MIKWIETTGRSEEDAISAALFQLGLDRDDVSVSVVERAKSGFLGFGSNPAKVRVSYEVPDEPQAQPEAPVVVAEPTQAPEPAPVVAVEAPKETAPAKPAPKTTPRAEKPAVTQEAPAPVSLEGDEKADHIVAFLTGLMEHMGVDAVPHVTRSRDDRYQVVLQGEKLGAIIGRHGETLDAIQQLTNYAVNRGHSRRVRIHMDAEGYRAKREEALTHLAVKVAGKVVKYHKNVTLDSMNAYERHVIHAALQEYPGVSTFSTGVEPNRRTVVTYNPDKK